MATFFKIKKKEEERIDSSHPSRRYEKEDDFDKIDAHKGRFKESE